MSLLVVGNIAFDTICRVKFLPDKNEATAITELRNCFGGCAGNVAVIAKILGIDAGLYSSVGFDFKRSDYERRLIDLDIDMENLQYVGDATARSFIFSDEKGRQQIYYFSGASYHLPYRKVSFSRYKYVHFTAGEIKVYRDMMKDAEDNGCVISFDPGQEIFHRDKKEILDCLPYPDYLFFNRFEIDHLMQKSGIGSINDLFSENTKAIIVSMGEKGSILYTDGGKRIDIPAVKVNKILDPTGAGDAHRAGFLAGIIKGYSESTACKIGSIVSSFVIQEIGAQENIPSWEDVVKIYKKHFGQMI